MKTERTLNFYSVNGKTIGFVPHTSCYKLFKELIAMLQEGQKSEAKKRIFLEYNTPVPTELKNSGINLVDLYQKYRELLSSVALYDEEGKEVREGLSMLLKMSEKK